MEIKTKNLLKSEKIPVGDLRYVDVDFLVRIRHPFIKHEVNGILGFETGKELNIVNTSGTRAARIGDFCGEISDEQKAVYKDFFGSDIFNAKDISSMGQYYKVSEIIGHRARPFQVNLGKSTVSFAELAGLKNEKSLERD